MKTISLSDPNVLDETIATLKAGGLVVFPCDTVYGLLADAKSEDGVKRLIEFKNRPPGKPISLFVADLEMAKQYVELSATQEYLLHSLLPGPYTIVLPSKHLVRPELEAEDGTLGIRIPLHKEIQELTLRFGSPITATSANLASTPPHYSSSSFLNSLPEKKKESISLLVDGGKLPHNKPSTVVDLSGSSVRVLREGDIITSHKREYTSHSESETRNVASSLFREIRSANGRPLVFILQGDLGAGKTVFVQGLGEELDIEDIVSPTFVIYYEYEIRNNVYNKLYHYDLYQIKSIDELNYFDLANMVDKNTITCIEWGEKSADIMIKIQSKASVVHVVIEHLNESSRKITVLY